MADIFLFQNVDEVKEILDYVHTWLKDGTIFFEGASHFNHLCYWCDAAQKEIHYVEIKANRWSLSSSSSLNSIIIRYKDHKNEIINSLPFDKWNCDEILENTVYQFKTFEDSFKESHQERGV